MTIETMITAAGLPGIALGTLAEGETVAFLGGVLSHRGFFPLWQVALAAMLGAIAADNLFFLIGRKAGQGTFARRLLSKGPVAALATRLDRHPTAAILGFRFLYGLKSAGALLIGTTATPWARFAVLDALACALWAVTFTALGYASGNLLHRLFGPLLLHWHLLLAVGLFLIALAALHRLRR